MLYVSIVEKTKWKDVESGRGKGEKTSKLHRNLLGNSFGLEEAGGTWRSDGCLMDI